MEFSVGDRVERISDGVKGAVVAVGIVEVDVLFDGDGNSVIILKSKIRKIAA